MVLHVASIYIDFSNGRFILPNSADCMVTANNLVDIERINRMIKEFCFGVAVIFTGTLLAMGTMMLIIGVFYSR